MQANTDRWIARVQDYGNDLKKMENMLLNRLPYGVLNKVAETIQHKWPIWEPYAIKLASKDVSSAKEWILHVGSAGSTTKLQVLLDLAERTNHLAITTCLMDCPNLMQQRQKAAQDISKGYMDDIHEDTIKELAQRIGDSPTDWRLLADGLGYDNLACQRWTRPIQMLKDWIQKNPNATVCRLHFEATQLQMKSVCRCLDAIPLEGVPLVTLPSHPDEKYFRPVTYFDLVRMFEILGDHKKRIDWEMIALQSISSIVKQNPTISPIDLIWISCRMYLNHFLNTLDNLEGLKPYIEKFKDEVKDEIFEPKSAAGISYSQIYYLGKSIYQAKIDLINIFSFFHSGVSVDLLKEKHLPSLHLGRSLSFTEFLLLYWQFNGDEKALDLKTFSIKIIDMLEHTQNQTEKTCPIFIEAFKKGYLEIKPCRSFDPNILCNQIEQENLRDRVEKSQKVAKEIFSKVEKNVRDDCCGICMNRKFDAVVLPCAHLGYCLECLGTLKECPMCRTPIVNRIKVFFVNPRD
jgi:hypothetical protein